MPQVDYPTISVSASLSGASPDTMASSIATLLERKLGVISDVTEMTSSSSTGATRITLQFGLNRDVDGATLAPVARDHLAAQRHRFLIEGYLDDIVAVAKQFRRDRNDRRSAALGHAVKRRANGTPYRR